MPVDTLSGYKDLTSSGFSTEQAEAMIRVVVRMGDEHLVTRARFEERAAEVDRRFNQVDERFNQVDKRFNKLEGEMAKLRADVTTEIAGVKTSVNRRMTALAFGAVAFLGTLMGLFEYFG